MLPVYALLAACSGSPPSVPHREQIVTLTCKDATPKKLRQLLIERQPGLIDNTTGTAALFDGFGSGRTPLGRYPPSQNWIEQSGPRPKRSPQRGY